MIFEKIEMENLKHFINNIIRLPERIKQIHSGTIIQEFNHRKEILEKNILFSDCIGISDQDKHDKRIIVSITSYDKRLYEVPYTIESLFQQTLKPDKIILWLPDSIKEKDLPIALKLQRQRGLTIEFTPDIFSYKKLIPALKKYPDDIIITFDDDAIYEYDLIERFMTSYNKQKNAIHAGRTRKMSYTDSGKLKSYHKWRPEENYKDDPYSNFFVGCGGVLYPPGTLNHEIFNSKTFLNICPTADDVWFNAMARMNGTLIHKIITREKNGIDFITNPYIQDTALHKKNLYKRLNDKQIQVVFSKYSIYDKINKIQKQHLEMKPH